MKTLSSFAALVVCASSVLAGCRTAEPSPAAPPSSSAAPPSSSAAPPSSSAAPPSIGSAPRPGTAGSWALPSTAGIPGAPSPPPVSPADSIEIGMPSRTISGEVIEKIDGDGRSFVRIRTSVGDTWAAIPMSPVAVGGSITVLAQAEKTGAEAKAINPRFDRIFLGSLAAPSGDSSSNIKSGLK